MVRSLPSPNNDGKYEPGIYSIAMGAKFCSAIAADIGATLLVVFNGLRLLNNAE